MAESGAHECLSCPVGFYSAGETNCTGCPLGYIAENWEMGECRRCGSGRYSINTSMCFDCPVTPGLQCENGVVYPRAEYMSPANLSGFLGEADFFHSKTVVLKCLTKESCLNNDLPEDRVLTPRTAWRCAVGHTGAICGACAKGYFMRESKCWDCSGAVVRGGAITAIIVASAGILLVGAMLMLARKRADRLLAALKRMKRTIKKDIRKMKRHQHETRKKARRAIQGYKGAKVPARGTLGNAKHVQLRLQRAAVVSVHEFVKNAAEGRFDLGESVRILINLAKVVHHLCQSRLRETLL